MQTNLQDCAVPAGVSLWRAFGDLAKECINLGNLSLELCSLRGPLQIGHWYWNFFRRVDIAWQMAPWCAPITSLWEMILERGVRDCRRWMDESSHEKILAEAKQCGWREKPDRDLAVAYWLNGPIPCWINALIGALGNLPETDWGMRKDCARQVAYQVIVPFNLKIGQLQPTLLATMYFVHAWESVCRIGPSFEESGRAGMEGELCWRRVLCGHIKRRWGTYLTVEQERLENEGI